MRSSAAVTAAGASSGQQVEAEAPTPGSGERALARAQAQDERGAARTRRAARTLRRAARACGVTRREPRRSGLARTGGAPAGGQRGARQAPRRPAGAGP